MPGHKVLIVDPNPRASLSARRILLGEDHEVLVANGVADAVRVAEQHDPDVVVLDAELAAPYTLRELARVTHPELDIVLTVGHSKVTPVPALEDVRIAATVRKPFMAAALVEAVDRAVGANEDPTVDGIEAIASPFDTIEDDPDVTPRAQWLANRIGSELPGVNDNPIQRRLLTRACALALEEEALSNRPAPSADGEIALEGRVGPIPIEQIFHLAENMPGRVGLCFARGEQRIELYFEDRMLVFGRGHALPPGYTLGGFLVDQGAITPDDLEQFLREQSSPFVRLGEQLERLGYVPREAVTRALVSQVQLFASEAIRWIGSTFTILRDVRFPEAAESADVQLPVAFVLLEGMRQLDEWSRVVDQIGGLSAVPVRRSDFDERAVEGLSPRERFLLLHVDGESNVEEVARRARRPAFDVCCALAELRGRRLLTVA